MPPPSRILSANWTAFPRARVYHHFNSKEEILDAVGDRMFFANNPFEAVRGRSDLNGLQKLREVIRLNQADEARVRMTVQAIPITQNPGFWWR